MTDREMLEFAAKAAGIRINHWVYDDLDSSPAVLETGEAWNPRDDDGDALRLAVKCEMSLDLFDDLIRVGYTLPDESLRPADRTAEVIEWPKADPAAATRRAIFRAAAEIGRNMP